jgi:hypothetical protein
MENESTEHHNCEICKFSCRYVSDWKRHVETVKHKNKCQPGNIGKQFAEKNESDKFVCKNCNLQYKTNSGLWKHNKICTNVNNNNYKTSELNDKELIVMLIKENSELKNMMMEVIKNGTHNTTNNINNNNNKTFNLQVFLNETCKDAMNIMDFVDSIKLELSDLESVGELGYVKGLSNIIVKNLRALDVTKRPVHCSDAKREILYVKDNDVWEKEEPDNNKMKKAVKYIAYKNTKLLPLWKQTYPECMQYESSKNDKYNYMVIEAMGGMGDNEGEKINKIIKQIAKEVIIEK